MRGGRREPPASFLRVAGTRRRMRPRYPGPFEGVLMGLGAAAVGVVLYELTLGHWSDVGGASVFAAVMFAAGLCSRSLGRRRRRY